MTNPPVDGPVYLFPELYRTEDFLTPVLEAKLQVCESECRFRSTIPCDPDVFHLCNAILAESQLPKDYYKAAGMGKTNKQKIKQIFRN